MSYRIVVLHAALLAACTPHLTGTCTSNADCKAGETCSVEHLCLTEGAGGDTASVDIIAPTNGSNQPGHFHVSAQATSSVAIHDVTFNLTNPQTSAALGSVVGTAAGNAWSGDLVLSQSSFGGLADLRAVVHRTGLADVVSAKVTVTIDQNGPAITPSWNAARWWGLDAGIVLTADVSDDRTGVASAFAELPDGGSSPANFSPGVATFNIPGASVGSAGEVRTVPISLRAADGVGNQFFHGDAGVVRVDGQPPSISVEALDPAAWRGVTLDFTATVDDGAGSGLGSASLLVNGAFVAGTPDAGGVFTFHADFSRLPPTEGPVALQVVAADAVGNAADAGFSLTVDNVPPAITTPRIDTPADGTDTGGQGWFQGSTIAPAAGPIVVSAAITDTNLITSGTGAPEAVAGANRYPGTFDSGSGRWKFSIPRGAGDVPVLFDASDAAGNHPASSPGVLLRFDDVAFTVSVTPDTTWYARGATITPSVGVTLSAAPASGVNTVVLQVSGKPDVACTGSGTSYSCMLPSIYAPAGQEAPLPVSIVATAYSGHAASGNGSTNIDDVAPVVSAAAAIPYPAAASGPLSWGSDGAHFGRRDSGTLYTFTGYDCGRGIATGATSATFSPSPSSQSVSQTDSGTRHACSNGTNAIVFNFTFAANLATAPFGALDNALTLSLTVGDGLAGHTASAQKNVGVTRKLWTAAPGAAVSFLALGPRLFASGAGGLYSFDPANGTATTWASTSPSDTFVLPNGGTPAVIYSDGLFVNAGSAASADASFLGSCMFDYGAPTSSDSFVGMTYELLSGSAIGVQSSWSSCLASTGCGLDVDCKGFGANCGIADGCQAHCTSWGTSTNQGGMTVSGASVACSKGSGSVGPLRCNGAPAAPAGLATPVSNASATYIGASGVNWVVANTASTWGGPIAAGHGWPLIDGSGLVAYLPDVAGGGIDAVTFGGSGFGARLYNLSAPFPGVISDMTMASNGVLFALSGNTLFAIVTDSSGSLANQAAAWPARCHDACGSSLAGFSCPF